MGRYCGTRFFRALWWHNPTAHPPPRGVARTNVDACRARLISLKPSANNKLTTTMTTAMVMVATTTNGGLDVWSVVIQGSITICRACGRPAWEWQPDMTEHWTNGWTDTRTCCVCGSWFPPWNWNSEFRNRRDKRHRRRMTRDGGSIRA